MIDLWCPPLSPHTLLYCPSTSGLALSSLHALLPMQHPCTKVCSATARHSRSDKTTGSGQATHNVIPRVHLLLHVIVSGEILSFPAGISPKPQFPHLPQIASSRKPTINPSHRLSMRQDAEEMPQPSCREAADAAPAPRRSTHLRPQICPSLLHSQRASRNSPRFWPLPEFSRYRPSRSIVRLQNMQQHAGPAIGSSAQEAPPVAASTQAASAAGFSGHLLVQRRSLVRLTRTR